MKKVRLTEKDLSRIVKRVIKENVDQDTTDQLDDLVNDAIDILRSMESFCDKAQMRYDIEVPEEVNSVEEDEFVSKVGHIDMMCGVFEKILRDYYY